MSNNKIESSSYIGPNVKMGKNNYIGHHTVIDGDVTIGDNNFFSHHVVIGEVAQNSVHKYELNGYPDSNRRKIVIGSNNVIREFSTVHLPMETETKISDNCYLMAYNHISHDTNLENNVILSNNIQIGGFTRIQKFANIGLSSTIHQFSTIGAYAMIGMGSIVSRDVPPFLVAKGAPIKSSGRINEVGLQRNGFSPDDIQIINRVYFGAASDIVLPDHLGEIITSFTSFSRRKKIEDGVNMPVLFSKDDA